MNNFNKYKIKYSKESNNMIGGSFLIKKIHYFFNRTYYL